jgi:biotin transport system substrate-specific component
MPSDRVKRLVYAALFAALTAVSAWVTIPLPFVPITLQTFFVMLSGVVLGPYFGALSMIVYLLLGLVGLPVFAGGQSGLGALVGPTGGYMIGFILCPIVAGLIMRMHKDPGIIWYGLAMLAGDTVIFILGLAQLSVVLHMPVDRAVIIGLLPFIPGDILKIIAASFVARKIKTGEAAQ